MTRPAVHRLLAIALTIALGIALAPATRGQEATPTPSSLANLGLPTLTLTITPDGLDLPAESPAGPTLLEVHNQTDGWMISSVSLLPDGVSDEEYIAALGADELPEWTADIVVAGGIDLPPHEMGQQVIVLTDGTWSFGASGDVPVAAPIAKLSVTGEVDAASTDAIPADLDVELGAYAFVLPDAIPTGPRVWRVTNSHSVLHHIVLFQADRLYTQDEVADGLMAEFSGTPVADGFSIGASTFVLAAAAISGGQTIWMETDLAPGYYVAFCFLPDPGGMAPHAVMGMIDTFEVTGS